MSNSVKADVEQILDERPRDERVCVLVEMEEPEIGPGHFLAEFLRDRSLQGLASSARDLAPAPAGERAKGTGGRRRCVRAGDNSLTALAGRGFSSLSLEQVKELSLKSLAPLKASAVTRKALAEAQQIYGPQFNEEAATLWPAYSMLLDIARDDLRVLVEEVPQIKAVHREHRFHTPLILEAENVPRRVTETKAAAWGVQKINALAAWGAYGTKGGGVTIGMLDSGIDPEHPDLRGKIAAWVEFDRKGLKVPCSTPHADGEHGTVVAGTLVGGNHGGPWIGVAPEAKLAAALVLNNVEGGTLPQLLAGIKWALEQRVDVLNMSLGRFFPGAETPTCFTNAIYSCALAGIPAVVAIGNEGEQTTNTPGSDFYSFSAGATDFDDNVAGFSGGRTQIIRALPNPNIPVPLFMQKPEVSAPGLAIRTTVPLNPQEPDEKWGNRNGTSLAAAHVSGAIALLLSATDIRERLRGWERFIAITRFYIMASVEELGEAGHDARFGFGRVDVLRAIGFAQD